jgi:hypothetical protein
MNEEFSGEVVSARSCHECGLGLCDVRYAYVSYPLVPWPGEPIINARCPQGHTEAIWAVHDRRLVGGGPWWWRLLFTVMLTRARLELPIYVARLHWLRWRSAWATEKARLATAVTENERL